MKRKAFLNALKTKLENVSDTFIGISIISLIVGFAIIGAVIFVHLNMPLTDIQVEQYKDIAESIYYEGFANTEIPDSISVSISDNFEIKVLNDDQQSIIVDFSEGEPNISINNGKISFGILGAIIGALAGALVLALVTLILTIIQKLKMFFDDLKFHYRMELKQLEKEEEKDSNKET